MRRLTLENVTRAHQGAIATLGNFDGVHRGHQRMIQSVLALARAENRPSMVILFEPQPLEFFSPTPPARLTTLDEKCALFEALGIDLVLCLDFNATLANQTAQDFIRTVLGQALEIKHVIVGDDFCFGKSRLGDLALLQALGPQYGFTSSGTGSIMDGTERISSTAIREALKEGDFTHAARLLGRPYTLRGVVQEGDKRGRELGYPTANIAPGRVVVPFKGVYAVKVHGLGAEPKIGMANMGTRPTVDGHKTLLEVHVLEFQGSLYGQTLEIEFCQKIREEQRFASLDALKGQIQADQIAVESYFHHG